MRRSCEFNDILETADHLSLQEKEKLIEVLRHRTRAARRNRLQREIASARREFNTGKRKPASPKQIRRDIVK
jgi:hypothetical protein